MIYLLQTTSFDSPREERLREQLFSQSVTTWRLMTRL